MSKAFISSEMDLSTTPMDFSSTRTAMINIKVIMMIMAIMFQGKDMRMSTMEIMKI
jgi:hypothetical protein